ncbi:uncharacterized protein LOC142503619 [Ascaphus truei]|uniref:uncharacterized protein LOC142503619 n=1 Tax=Ascaphus truei TaxID=8439 RepID=UPI003F5A4CDA
MGGESRAPLALLGVLCLVVSGALLPGVAQELHDGQNSALLTESPLVLSATSPTWEDSNTVHEVTGISSLSEYVDPTPRPQANENVTVVEQPVADVLVPNHIGGAGNATSTVTASPGENITESEGAASNQGETLPIQNSPQGEITSSILTQLTAALQPTDTARTEEITETTDSVTERPSLSTLGLPAVQSQSNTEPPAVATQAATVTSAFHTTWMAAITTSVFRTTTASPTGPATGSTMTSRTMRTEGQKKPSVLNVGDDEKEQSYYTKNSSNPLFVMIVSIFTIMIVMVVVVVGFHRYRRRNSRTEFRRLQDLPMDDMMEDTPLSLYSY